MAPVTELSGDRGRRADTAVLDKYRKALLEFQKPNENSLVKRADNSIRQHPNEDVEAYFEYVTKVGRSCLPWDIIKPAFLWKIKFVMDEMIRIDYERDGCSTEQPIGSELKQAYDFILNKASEFDGAPFTWQRICELLQTPSRHYKKADKFVRALDKNINVVTTVTENGARVTGIDWIPTDSSNGRIEQRFFGKVDEVDGDGDLWESEYKSGNVRASGDGVDQVEPLDMSTKKDSKDPMEDAKVLEEMES